MLRRLTAVIVSTCAMLALAVSPAWAEDELPDAMAGLGDSITRGFDACGFFVDCPYRSWTTGGSSSVDSHYRRILSENHDIFLHNYNDAVTGATMSDLADQASEAVDQGVDYVTILMGANDACKSSVEDMTPVGTFQQQLDEGLEVLREGLPEAKVFIASIPDVYQLWQVAKNEPEARSVWALGDICQALLDDPLSDDPADADRRHAVRQRVITYNQELAEACSAYGDNCAYDGGAVFEYDFTLEHISEWDYFHPSVEGQQVLAEITYEAGFDW